MKYIYKLVYIIARFKSGISLSWGFGKDSPLGIDGDKDRYHFHRLYLGRKS